MSDEMNSKTEEQPEEGAPIEVSEAGETVEMAVEPEEEVLPSQEELKALKEKAAKADEHWEQVLRAKAEFENYRKRVDRDRQEALKYAQQALIEDLLPILDNFEMAVMATRQADEKVIETLKTGVEMILGQFRNVLSDAGLSDIDAQGQEFDPNCHDAVASEVSTEVPEGRVLRQTRKGYRLRDRLLRPASVVVSKAPDEGASQEDSNPT